MTDEQKPPMTVQLDIPATAEEREARRVAAWDRWYDTLPADLRRRLSLHDFKRLGDCFKEAFGIREILPPKAAREYCGLPNCGLNRGLSRCAECDEMRARKIFGEAARAAPDPRDPDPTREGMFRDHNCYRCKSGERACVRGNPRNCEFPHARND